MLTDGERNQIAAERERAMMHEQAEIVTTVYASDGMGGQVETEDVLTVPCFRYPNMAGAGQPLVAGQLTQGLVWTIGLPLGTPVSDDSVIRIGGDTYDVISVLGPYTYETARTVLARAR